MDFKAKQVSSEKAIRPSEESSRTSTTTGGVSHPVSEAEDMLGQNGEGARPVALGKPTVIVREASDLDTADHAKPPRQNPEFEDGKKGHAKTKKKSIKKPRPKSYDAGPTERNSTLGFDNVAEELDAAHQLHPMQAMTPLPVKQSLSPEAKKKHAKKKPNSARRAKTTEIDTSQESTNETESKNEKVETESSVLSPSVDWSVTISDGDGFDGHIRVPRGSAGVMPRNTGDKDKDVSERVRDVLAGDTSPKIRNNSAGSGINSVLGGGDLVDNLLRGKQDSSADKSERTPLVRPSCSEEVRRKTREREAYAARKQLYVRIGIGACVCVFSLACILAITFICVGYRVGTGVMTYEDYPLEGDPQYLPFFYNNICLHLQESFGNLLEKLEAYNMQHGFKEVSFRAVGDDRTVQAYWLPAPDPQNPSRPLSGAPRVVLVHDIEGNYLVNAVQAAAYFLRSVGISVLVPNLRNHGGTRSYSTSTEDKAKIWQHQPYDVRGALKAALDGDAAGAGIIGGPADAGKVGVMGFGFGSLAAQVAFGQETAVEAFVSDGGVYNIAKLFEYWVDRAVSPLPVEFFLENAQSECKDLSKTDCATQEQSEHLKARGSSRGGSIGIIHSADDTEVPQDQSKLLEESLVGYSIESKWYPTFRGDTHDGTSMGNCVRRSETWLDRPEEYKSFLCNFFAKVFDGEGSTRCAGLQSPPAR